LLIGYPLAKRGNGFRNTAKSGCNEPEQIVRATNGKLDGLEPRVNQSAILSTSDLGAAVNNADRISEPREECLRSTVPPLGATIVDHRVRDVAP